MLSECFWPPLLVFQKNWISRRIKKISDNLTSLSIFTINKKRQFLWKYQYYQPLFEQLVLLRSKQRKYYAWNVYLHEQKGAFCNFFSTCKPAKTCMHFKAEKFSFLSKSFVYRKLKRATQKLSFCFKWLDTGEHTVVLLGGRFTLIALEGNQYKKTRPAILCSSSLLCKIVPTKLMVCNSAFYTSHLRLTVLSGAVCLSYRHRTDRSNVIFLPHINL